jgi:hypothetical protein
MAFVADTRMIANCWLRPGNTSSANNVSAFLDSTLNNLAGKHIAHHCPASEPALTARFSRYDGVVLSMRALIWSACRIKHPAGHTLGG